MQDFPLFPLASPPAPLLIKNLLDRVLTWAPQQTIVYRDLREFTYAEFFQRLQRLANVLRALGVKPGDRVGVMDYDSHRYLEFFFAVPMIGAVLHTINFRLAPEQIAYTINHADDQVLFLHADFAPVTARLRAELPSVKACVLLLDETTPPESPLEFAGEYEALLAAVVPHFDFPEFDENTVATLFYTTGTTGQPKGVFYTHRQLVLHSMSAGWTFAAHADATSLRQGDVYMPLTPMFHVHAWGVPYVATALGLKQVYLGRYEPHLILGLITRHHVTFSHCVPAILQMLLHHPTSPGTDLNGWKVLIGGAALPKGLAREATARGIHIVGGYGMSETCPIVAVSFPKPGAPAEDPEARLEISTRTGFPTLMVQAAVFDPECRPLPPGPENVGELVLRAPWLTTGYFRQPAESEHLWRGGWLHTGDVAYLDNDGYIRITDRLKDVIKIGGEWISSLELENALSQHPGVKEVAVVGRPDARWEERPHAEIVLHEAARGTVNARELMAFLRGFIDRGAIHQRAILTMIQITETIPRTSVGKLDKKRLRADLQALRGPVPKAEG